MASVFWIFVGVIMAMWYSSNKAENNNILWGSPMIRVLIAGYHGLAIVAMKLFFKL